MSLILLLGGYGGFGGRIAHRLAAAGHEVLVAGRSPDRAQAFCAGTPRLSPIVVDRAQTAEALRVYRPDLLRFEIQPADECR
ncbi:saccharopine dehydrogenase NADP-binding domain-containing protein [Sandaracinobacteroides hominis]|uniref:saccharopine dehydrogenase NADP-binding domain-containing protein n=1 Tax=Sandaracinobacteroides hominis TaxID=2780086 RepID=UPI0018F427DB|nr:saccharopine dehydrogenase NADP-binding domain-containing protein [Sandaracinobacteroides hominis]